MSLDTDVEYDLKEMKGDKVKLTQQYSDRQQEILKRYGGNISDLPVDNDHEYWILRTKIQILNRVN